MFGTVGIFAYIKASELGSIPLYIVSIVTLAVALLILLAAVSVHLKWMVVRLFGKPCHGKILYTSKTKLPFFNSDILVLYVQCPHNVKYRVETGNMSYIKGDNVDLKVHKLGVMLVDAKH